MKAVVAAFNQEKALVGAISVITNLRMELFQALLHRQQQGNCWCVAAVAGGWAGPGPGWPRVTMMREAAVAVLESCRGGACAGADQFGDIPVPHLGTRHSFLSCRPPHQAITTTLIYYNVTCNSNTHIFGLRSRPIYPYVVSQLVS